MPFDPKKTEQNSSADALKKSAAAVLSTEAEAIVNLLPRIDENFVRACEIMLECEARVVVTGMGKSGHIGGKIAATLASTGTPAFFVHPGEASHGDLGMITQKDVVLAMSNSGETNEILTILPLIKRLKVPLIAMTGNPQSRLAKSASVHIDISVEKEACPLGLAPTASTTATLAMGDALAVALLEARGFTSENFAHSHPGGSLGRRLLLQVGDIMHVGDEIPVTEADKTVREALMKITQKGLGFVVIADDQHRVLGVFTDGDLRRLLDTPNDFRNLLITDVMVKNCMTISPAMLAAQALEIMKDKKFNAFPVVDEDKQLVGAINMHDLLRAGL